MPRMRHGGRWLAAVGAAVLTFTLAACAPERVVDELPAQVEGSLPGETQTQMQSAVERAMAASGSSGAIVGVWVPWAGTWVAGLGTALPGGAATTADMTINAGNATRMMTCDVLYALVDAGEMALDDDITEWVIGVPELEGITLEQLCDSTSGYGGFSGKLASRILTTPERAWAPKELIAYGVSGEPAFVPGTSYLDSETGYVLLGLALERATGQSLDEMYETYVFDALELESSRFPTRAVTGATRLGGTRSPDVDGAVVCTEAVDLTATSPTLGSSAAGVVTDVNDLGRYAQAVATGARAYDTDARFDLPLPVTADGPSWFTTTGGAFQAGSLVGQFGSFGGQLTAAFADRNTGMTVVTVLNNSRASADLVKALAWQLAAIASTVPATEGSAPEAGLPWTVEAVAAEVDANAVCPLP